MVIGRFASAFDVLSFSIHQFTSRSLTSEVHPSRQISLQLTSSYPSSSSFSLLLIHLPLHPQRPLPLQVRLHRLLIHSHRPLPLLLPHPGRLHRLMW